MCLVSGSYDAMAEKCGRPCARQRTTALFEQQPYRVATLTAALKAVWVSYYSDRIVCIFPMHWTNAFIHWSDH